MKDSLIIIGAGEEQIRAYKLAKDMGLFVIGTDMNEQAPAFKFADFQLISSTRSIPETLESLEKLPIFCNIKGVMTIGNDCAPTVSAVAEHFSTSAISIKAARNASDKSLMKACFAKAGVPSPKYYLVDSKQNLLDIIHENGFPLVLKPTDGRGSRGVMLLENDFDVDFAFDNSLKNSETKQLIVEEFISGDQLSVEGIFVNGKYHGIAFADRNYSRLNETKPFIIEDGGVIPSKYEGKILEEITQCIEQASNSLGISEGPVKADIVLNDGQPMIIELAARLSGNYLASHHLRWAFGIDLVKAVINYSLGREIDKNELIPTKQKFLAARYFFPNEGIIESISGADDVAKDPKVKKLEIFRKPGDYQPKIEANIHRAGIVRCLGDSLDEVSRLAEESVKKIIFNLKSD